MSHCGKYGRRKFLTETSLGLGAMALGSIMNPLKGLNERRAQGLLNNLRQSRHFPARAKRVIYLFQSGGPSHMELFDYKPVLEKRQGEDIPKSVIGDQRLTGMSSGQASLPLVGSKFSFSQHGQSGTYVSELLPHTAKIIDELCVIKSMHTEAINHDPAVTFIQTGSQFSGRPSIGAWSSYGLGSDNENLPSFVVLITKGKQGGQPLYARLWGNGFLPSQHQGVQFRAGKDPVLFLQNPPGVGADNRRQQLDYLSQLGKISYDENLDPEVLSRMEQYEMAYRMQTSVPEIMDTKGEPDYIYDLYGEDSKEPGTFAANCLLARRLAERDVKFIQLYHQGWDAHGGLPGLMKRQCKETDQASAALITDLKQRGLLEDTLVIWGGEFGRTSYSQGQLTPEGYGRDHHPKCFTIYMAGAGVKKGITYGSTDDFGYNITKDPVHVHDFQATLMHLMGVDHERLTYKYQGRRFRLTDVHGHVVEDILS